VGGYFNRVREADPASTAPVQWAIGKFNKGVGRADFSDRRPRRDSQYSLQSVTLGDR
jgi:hypothetical protein